MKSLIGRVALSGWSVSAIVSYQSGQPYTAVVTGDLNNDLNRSNDRVPGGARNTLRLPSQTSIDPRLTRDIPLGRDLHLQLIGEAFNLTNRSNVTRARNAQYSFANNRLTQVSLNPITGFRSPSAVAGPRTYQFATKLLF